jgi:hypothetical protein
VRTFPAGDRVWRISDAGGVDPRWHPDGRELFYIRPDRTLVRVSLGAGEAFDGAVAQPVFDIGSDGLWSEARNHYDVAGDGRILTLRPITDPRQTPFTLMINWQAASK